MAVTLVEFGKVKSDQQRQWWHHHSELNLNYEAMITLLIEVEAIVISRPIIVETNEEDKGDFTCKFVTDEVKDLNVTSWKARSFGKPYLYSRRRWCRT